MPDLLAPKARRYVAQHEARTRGPPSSGLIIASACGLVIAW